MKKHPESRPFGFGITVVMLAGIIWMFSAVAWGGKTPEGAVLVGDETCLSCHDDIGENYAKTLHGALSEFSSGGKSVILCESCHGPGSAHAEEMDPELIVNPAKDDQFEESSTCLTCHNTEQFDNWTFAHHNGGDVSCSSCHKVHTEAKEWTQEEVLDLCYQCHAEVRAETMMPSHHPVREGKMSCLDCHNPHGGQTAFSMEFTNREMCFSCHPEKEGPFIFEHAPANEDCMLCHNPHGSVADNLLISNEPTLCLNCHSMHFHATIEGWDGDFTDPLEPSRNGTSTPEGWKIGMLTKCTQCHTAIHGSDMPSQTISTGGNALTR